MSRVTEIDGLVSELAAFTQEQTTGLREINTAVNLMDQVTPQTAAMVEESTAVSQSLSNEVEQLVDLIACSKLRGEPRDLLSRLRERSVLSPVAA